MKSLKQSSPHLALLVILILLVLHGPIAQLPNYHDFADQRVMGALPNALDVLSNLPFLVVGVWGLCSLLINPHHGITAREITSLRPAYIAFCAALTLTAFGSSYYHLAPDDARLIWDRLPIAMACGALLSAGYSETHSRTPTWLLPALLSFGVTTVLWWVGTNFSGSGDLRPYLALQGAPLILIPLWQWRARSPIRDRVVFAFAVALYVLAKVAELNDAQILNLFGVISGHTLKHLLASMAALVLCTEIIRKSTARAPFKCFREATV